MEEAAALRNANGVVAEEIAAARKRRAETGIRRRRRKKTGGQRDGGEWDGIEMDLRREREGRGRRQHRRRSRSHPSGCRYSSAAQELLGAERVICGTTWDDELNTIFRPVALRITAQVAHHNMII